MLNNHTYSVSVVPGSGHDGNYMLLVDLPGLPPNTPPGTLYVQENAGGTQTTVPTGIYLSVSPFDTLTFTPQAVTIQEGQTAGVSIGSISDSLGSDSDPSTYEASFTVNGQSIPVTYYGSAGNYTVQTSSLPFLTPSPTPYTGTISVFDATRSAAHSP